MKQLYVLSGVVLALIIVLFVLARLPGWLAQPAGDSPDGPPPEPTEEELMAFEASLNENTPEELLNNQEALTMDSKPITETGAVTTATMKTNYGDIVIELFTEKAPITAGNFVKLAGEGYYDGIKFHRVVNNFMIQGGDPNSKNDNEPGTWGRGGPGYTIEDEFVAEFTNQRGTLSMANAGPNTGGSQFFINTNRDHNNFLDGRHAVFGQVVSGMEVVDRIEAVEVTMNSGGEESLPVEPVIIESVTVE